MKQIEFEIIHVENLDTAYKYLIRATTSIGEITLDMSRVGEDYFWQTFRIPPKYIDDICKKYDYMFLLGYFFKFAEDAQKVIEELEALLVIDKLSGGLF